MRRRRGSRKRASPVPALRAQLAEAEATLDAIRTGQVDAIVVSSPAGERTRAIEGATHPYYVLLNAMSDGAALLERHGAILFGNRRLAELGRVPLESLRGFHFQQLVAPAERAIFARFLRDAGRCDALEFALAGGDEPATPVRIALSPVNLEDPGGTGAHAPNGTTVLVAIVTDLTDRKEAEATRLGLTKRLMFAQDEERRRIARELHDETGQSLAALAVGLRAIEEQAITVDVRSAAQRLQRVAEQTVGDIGRLARGLHPSVLDDVGLGPAAKRYVGDYARSFGISVDFASEGPEGSGIPPLVATTMYRILQEALTNVARHARARKVVVGLTGDGSTLELLVRDDGVGFAGVAGLSETAGLGLHGMRERVALLGGSLEIDSRPGHGTIVRARIPVGIAPPRTNPEPAPA
ncbi:MAG TPA: ATP-binding protein [Gemmatimonadales bacterium]|nr:ATP-binding protein [Gemmatimonadales bacterium]